MSLWKVDSYAQIRTALKRLSLGCRGEIAELLAGLREEGPDLFPDARMRSFEDLYRIRVCGSYRLIFRASRSRKRILLVRLEPRSTAYRGFER